MIFYPGPSRLPDSPEGMHAWHSREGVVDGRKGGGRDTHTYTNIHEMNDQCKKKKRTNKAEDPTSSQGKQMDHTSDLHTNTVSSHTIKSRSRRLVFVVSLLYQGCDSEESKTNQQLKVYAALSQQLLSFMTTLQPKTPKTLSCPSRFVLVFLVKVPCLV